MDTSNNMKLGCLIPLALLLLGCSTTAPRTRALTADQAGVLAQQLANEKAETLFHRQPFQSHPAQFVDGHWVWHALHGQGGSDAEAVVKFAADGANPDVQISVLTGVTPFPARGKF